MSLGPAGRAGRPVSPPVTNDVEVEMEMPVPRVRNVTLRRFAFQLTPLVTDGRTDGLKLMLIAADIGCQVSALFDRAEFVNIATAGMTMLDVADATEGGETHDEN